MCVSVPLGGEPRHHPHSELFLLSTEMGVCPSGAVPREEFGDLHIALDRHNGCTHAIHCPQPRPGTTRT